jgi:hypothetical protein
MSVNCTTMGAWVVLSSEWRLQDVQAGLNVIINVLCIVFIFTAAQFFWHLSARRLSRGGDAPISSLFTFTTLGEVMDIGGLLKSQIFDSRYFRILIQSVVVVFFTLASIFAGPISRYSTRAGLKVDLHPVTGLQAARALSCDVNNNVRQNTIFVRLDEALFPLDQLLDYLPDVNTDWVYDQEQWNSTYLADCKITPHTSIKLTVTDTHTNDSLWLYNEIPGLWDVLSPRFRRDNIIHSNFYGGVRNPETGVWEHVIIWQYADLSSSEVSNEQNASTQQTTISLSAVYMKDAPEYNITVSNLDTKDWVFGVGDVPEAYYSKVECDLKRNRPVDDNLWEAYPQIRTNCNLAKELDVYYSAGAIKPADGTGINMDINLPTGESLFRFYQSWMIAKDTYYPFPSTRPTSVRLRTVELSIIFIVICSIILAILLLGLLHWAIVKWRYRKSLDRFPETKVDWILQSVREARFADMSDVESPPQAQVDPNSIQEIRLATTTKEIWRTAIFSSQGEIAASKKRFGRVQVETHLSKPGEPRATAPIENDVMVQVLDKSGAISKSNQVTALGTDPAGHEDGKGVSEAENLTSIRA